MKKIIVLLLPFMVSLPLFSQENQQYVSVRDADIMYRKSLVRAIDLREKQNKPLFSKNKEITALLIAAVKRGDIIPYSDDSLNKRLTIEEFMSRLKIPSTEPDMDTIELYITYGPEWRDFQASMQPDYYFPRDLYQIELKEDLYFDKGRSRMYYDIHTLTFFVPADHPQNIRGIQQTVASFDFRVLEQGLFRDHPDAHFNVQNDAYHKNLADAFKLRMFSSYIVKVSNADDAYIQDMFPDQRTALMASHWAAYELMEFEHHLWEY